MTRTVVTFLFSLSFVLPKVNINSFGNRNKPAIEGAILTEDASVDHVRTFAWLLLINTLNVLLTTYHGMLSTGH